MVAYSPSLSAWIGVISPVIGFHISAPPWARNFTFPWKDCCFSGVMKYQSAPFTLRCNQRTSPCTSCLMPINSIAFSIDTLVSRRPLPILVIFPSMAFPHRALTALSNRCCASSPPTNVASDFGALATMVAPSSKSVWMRSKVSGSIRLFSGIQMNLYDNPSGVTTIPSFTLKRFNNTSGLQ